jgi:hypothetical protein
MMKRTLLMVVTLAILLSVYSIGGAAQTERAGGPSFDFVFMLPAHNKSITLLDVSSEYHEGAPCSTRAAGERGVLRLLNAKKSCTLLRQRPSAFYYV